MFKNILLIIYDSFHNYVHLSKLFFLYNIKLLVVTWDSYFDFKVRDCYYKRYKNANKLRL